MTNYNLQDFRLWLQQNPTRSRGKQWTNFDFDYVWKVVGLENYILLTGQGVDDYIKTLQTWMEEVDKAERERERERESRKNDQRKFLPEGTERAKSEETCEKIKNLLLNNIK